MSDETTFENFDPNLTNKSNVWGVYAGSTFKTKSARPAALNAVSHASRAKLFELVNGTWLLRAVKDPDDLTRSTCETCGASLLKAMSRWDYKTNTITFSHDFVAATWIWRREKGRITSPPELLRLCNLCSWSHR